MKTNKKSLSIYIHIPFCVKKCLYCDFLSGAADDYKKESYVNCLLDEIEKEAPGYLEYEVKSLFIGGGTPSILEAKEIERIVGKVKKSFSMAEHSEITIEVNPGTVDMKKLETYRNAGINRLSIGLQSANNDELKLLGRIHTYEDFINTYNAAVKSGFKNINIDLMSAIPMQTIESYCQTLTKVLSLSPVPTHISAYSLIIEEGTAFYENTPMLPDEDTDREMYKITNDILTKNGYHRYEISNYAKEGYECEHNKVYWKRGDYVGFGIGAASLIDNMRFHNVRDLETYILEMKKSKQDAMYVPALKEDLQYLSVEEQMEEYMFLGLRLTEGVCIEDFYQVFHKRIDEIYSGIVDSFCKKGLLCCETAEYNGKRYIALTEKGLDVSNFVMAEFLLSVGSD